MFRDLPFCCSTSPFSWEANCFWRAMLCDNVSRPLSWSSIILTCVRRKSSTVWVFGSMIATSSSSSHNLDDPEERSAFLSACPVALNLFCSWFNLDCTPSSCRWRLSSSSKVLKMVKKNNKFPQFPQIYYSWTYSVDFCDEKSNFALSWPNSVENCFSWIRIFPEIL